MLFRHFLSQQNRNEFGTGAYRLNKKVLWESIRIGFPKLVSKAVVVTIWVANVHVMTLKGGDHLLVLSIGSTFGLLFLFLNEGLCQGVLTIASYALGKKDNEAISRLLRSGLLFLLASTVIVAIPCLFFPKWFIACFFSKVITYTQMNLMNNTLQCFWFFFICQGLTGTYMLLAAKKDTLFTMCYNLLFTWLFQYIPLFFAMHRWNWTGDKFYLILGCGNLASATIYFIRFMKLWKPTLSRILQDES
jgi:Na+-driven multidrug efflux pump